MSDNSLAEKLEVAFKPSSRRMLGSPNRTAEFESLQSLPTSEKFDVTETENGGTQTESNRAKKACPVVAFESELMLHNNSSEVAKRPDEMPIAFDSPPSTLPNTEPDNKMTMMLFEQYE